MRCLLIIPAILILGISASAQYTETNFEEFNDLYFRNRSLVDYLGYKDIEGHPWSNEELVSGTVEFLSGSRMDSVPMRYNWYTKKMEFKPKEEILEMPVSNNIKHIELGGKKYTPFFYLKSVQGYLIELHRDDLSLFQENRIIFSDVQPATSGYEDAKPARFRWGKPTFIVITDKGNLIRLKQNKKGLISQFPDYEDELSAYLKSNKTDLKLEENLISLVIQLNIWKKAEEMK